MRLVSRHLVDGALLVDFPDASNPEANELARALRQQLAARALPGVLDTIPGGRTLLILFDPAELAMGDLEDSLRTSPVSNDIRQPRSFRIPVRYGDQMGPDLEELARKRGLSPGEAVRLHVRAEYRVAFIGFSPGFPYLLGLPPALQVPRLASPRLRVPAGSVGIGGEYTGIYPDETPGGWNIIGRAAARLFDPGADSPSLLSPGDTVEFEEVSEAEFTRLSGLAKPAPRPPARTAALFRVLQPGLYTTVQGAPRFGLGALGVPSGGAMDLDALSRANALLDNPLLAPGLEITLTGPELEVLQPCRVCLAGAQLSAELDGRSIGLEKVIDCRPGQRLRVGAISHGARSYLCVTGGLGDPTLPGETPRAIKEGQLVCGAERLDAQRSSLRLPSVQSTSPFVLRAVPGPQDEHFTERGKQTFFSSEYRISSQSDRRGIRLEGPAVELVGTSDISPEGTAPGSVQVPGNALPIVLGPDRPVTGGYAKIATVIGADLGRLAQARPGNRVRFECVSVEQAVTARGR